MRLLPNNLVLGVKTKSIENLNLGGFSLQQFNIDLKHLDSESLAILTDKRYAKSSGLGRFHRILKSRYRPRIIPLRLNSYRVSDFILSVKVNPDHNNPEWEIFFCRDVSDNRETKYSVVSLGRFSKYSEAEKIAIEAMIYFYKFLAIFDPRTWRQMASTLGKPKMHQELAEIL